VTEAEWLAAADPRLMLEFLRGRACDRKLRLLVVACCRRARRRRNDLPVERVLDAADGFVAGTVSGLDLRAVYDAARCSRSGDSRTSWAMICAASVAVPDAPTAARLTCDQMADDAGHRAALGKALWWSEAANRRGRAAEAAVQSALLRDLFGNPFRPAPAVEGAWLRWRDGVVPLLAEGAYDDRQMPEGTLDPARLAVVADALEDAGCTEAGLLSHLRSPGPHVRGCWAVDLVLAKE
jgi:hypothetical protein